MLQIFVREKNRHNEGVMSLINKDISLSDYDLRSYISTYVKNKKTNSNESKLNFIEYRDYKFIVNIDDENVGDCYDRNKAKNVNAANDNLAIQNNETVNKMDNNCDQQSKDDEKCYDPEVRP